MGTRDFLFSVRIKTSLGTHPASSTTGTGAPSQAKGGWGVALMTHPLIVQKLKMERSILLPHLCASTGRLRVTFAFVHNLREPKRQQKFCSYIITFTILLPVNRTVRYNEPLSQLLVNRALQVIQCQRMQLFTIFHKLSYKLPNKYSDTKSVYHYILYPI